MSASPQVDLSTLSRRELQYLARELELCRGNAKSDVIVDHLVAFVADKGAQALQEVLDNMPADIKARTPGATSATPVKRARGAKGEQITPRAMDFSEDTTPLRRSVRKSPRTATPSRQEQPEAEKTSTPSVVRAMQFESAALKEEDGGEVTENQEIPTPKPTSSPVASLTISSPKSTPKDEKNLTDSGSSGATSAIGATKHLRSPLADVTNTPSKSQQPPSDVAALVASASDLVFVDANRVKCVSTGHEMKADYDVITTYTSGKRYQRAQKQKKSFAAYAPMFVDHPDESKPHMLWCSVTQTAIPRDVERVEAHIQGARYQKELPQWRLDQATKQGEEEEGKEKVDYHTKKRKASSSPRHDGFKVAKR